MDTNLFKRTPGEGTRPTDARAGIACGLVRSAARTRLKNVLLFHFSHRADKVCPQVDTFCPPIQGDMQNEKKCTFRKGERGAWTSSARSLPEKSKFMQNIFVCKSCMQKHLQKVAKKSARQMPKFDFSPPIYSRGMLYPLYWRLLRARTNN